MQSFDPIAEVYSDDVLQGVVRVPRECVRELLRYLEKRGGSLPMLVLVRIFVANWKAGVNLAAAMDRQSGIQAQPASRGSIPDPQTARQRKALQRG